MEQNKLQVEQDDQDIDPGLHPQNDPHTKWEMFLTGNHWLSKCMAEKNQTWQAESHISIDKLSELSVIFRANTII